MFVNLIELEVLHRGVMSTGMARSLDKMLITSMSSLEAKLNVYRNHLFFLSNLDLFVQSTVDASDSVQLEIVK